MASTYPGETASASASSRPAARIACSGFSALTCKSTRSLSKNFIGLSFYSIYCRYVPFPIGGGRQQGQQLPFAPCGEDVPHRFLSAQQPGQLGQGPQVPFIPRRRQNDDQLHGVVLIRKGNRPPQLQDAHAQLPY